MVTDKRTITRWVETAQRLCIDFISLFGLFSRHPRLSAEHGGILADLLTAAARSTQSVVYLVNVGCLWDAEIVMRSAMEATLKFLHILEDQSTFELRIGEYANDLFDIGLLKNHQKANELLSTVDNPDDPQWKPIRDLLLTEDELASLRAKYPDHVRRDLDRRWGFTGLIAELRKSKVAVERYLPGLLHNYAISSHILHADCQGVSIVLERERRETERRDAIHLAHAARLLSDVMSFTAIRVVWAYRFVDADPSEVMKLYEDSAEFREELEAAYESWIEIEYPRRSGTKARP